MKGFVYSLLVIALFQQVHSAAYDFTGYPLVNQVGPTPKQAWVNKYLAKNGNIPQVPINNQPILHPDWTPDYTSCNDSKAWAITYDDGPGRYTPALLDHLKALGVKVTFFVVGSRVREGSFQADTLLRAYKEGHQIGIHTWSHRPITLLTNEELLGEILWTGKIIQQVIGVFPTYFRPPVGDIDERTRAVIQSVGLKIVVWNQDSSDWFFSTIPPQNNFTEAQEIAKFKYWIAHPSEAGTIQEGNTNGFISLQHDLFNRSASMAVPTLQLVQKAGYHVMPVGHCIGDEGSWYVSWEDTNSTVLYSKPTTTTTRPTVPVATLDPANSDAETEDMNTFAVDTAVVSHHSKAVLSRRITEWILLIFLAL